MHAKSAAYFLANRKSFLSKWKLRCLAFQIAWRMPANCSSPSCATRPNSVARYAPLTPFSCCISSSSGVSRRSACCPVPRPPPLVPSLLSSVQITLRKSTARRASPSPRRALTSLPDPTNHTNFIFSLISYLLSNSSQLFALVRDGQFFHVTMGTLVDDPGIRPKFHIFVVSTAPWHEFAELAAAICRASASRGHQVSGRRPGAWPPTEGPSAL